MTNRWDDMDDLKRGDRVRITGLPPESGMPETVEYTYLGSEPEDDGSRTVRLRRRKEWNPWPIGIWILRAAGAFAIILWLNWLLRL